MTIRVHLLQLEHDTARQKRKQISKELFPLCWRVLKRGEMGEIIKSRNKNL